MPNFRIVMDRDQDGSYAWDISDAVIELRWRLGMRAPYDSMADAGWARITVRNPGGAFSPERTPLQPGARVQIRSVHKGATRTHFTGAIDHIDPDEGDYGDKRAVIHLIDIMPWLAASPARIPPQHDVTADRVIAQALDRAAIRRAVLAGYCLIDAPGHNRIDSVRVFPPENHPRQLQAGKTRFAFVGDWWTEDTSAKTAIADLVASERGRFYLDREGTAVFLNRHYTLVHHSIAARFDDDMLGMDYRYGDQRLNRIVLRMTPREIGQPDTLLWQLPAPLTIAQDSERLLTLRLRDERDRPVGLLAFGRLSARFETSSSGGRTLHAGVRADVAEVGASSLLVRVSNPTRRAVYLTRLQAFGKPLYRRDPLEIVAADGASTHLYGLRRMALDLPALSDMDLAQAFADYELARRKHPQGIVRELRIDARQRADAALRLSLFDRIRVSEAQTGHSQSDYFIIAEAHHVADGGKRHTVAYTLEAADSTRFVIINESRVDSAERVLAPH